MITVDGQQAMTLRLLLYDLGIDDLSNVYDTMIQNVPMSDVFFLV